MYAVRPKEYMTKNHSNNFYKVASFAQVKSQDYDSVSEITLKL